MRSFCVKLLFCGVESNANNDVGEFATIAIFCGRSVHDIRW